MLKNSDEKAVLKKIIDWAKRKTDIRAVLLTSSRTKPNAKLDEFSDYDIILVAKDIKPYHRDSSWLDDFGKVLVVYRDPVVVRYGFKKFIWVTQYESGLKLDLTLWPVGLAKRVAGLKKLPPWIEDGYKVLLDKDGLTRGMQPPSYNAFPVKPPTAAEYYSFIETAFSDVPYAVKQICRGDHFPLQFTFHLLRSDMLARVLEWKIGIGHNWSLPGAPLGKSLLKYLTPALIKEIVATNAGTGREADWESLFRFVRLFGKIAREVGDGLGYRYPEDMEKRILLYIERVKSGELP